MLATPSSRGGTAQVLKNATLNVGAGEMVTLQGSSGTGKTVLGSLLLRLRKVPSGGRVWWGDREVTSLRSSELQPLRTGFQAMLQYTGALLPPYCSIGSSFQETLRHVVREDRAEAEARITRLAGELGIDHLLHRSPRFLSGGEQRRATLARVLLSRPRFAFIDEPDAGLDPVSQQEVLGLIRRVSEERGMGVLLVTHHRGLARRYSDRCLELRKGQAHVI